MALTLAEMIVRIADNAGRQDQTGAYSVPWLNDALHELARRHDWRDLHVPDSPFTMTAGVYRYTFPTDMKVCKGIRYINGSSSKWLVEKTRYWLNQYEPYPDSMSNGIPAYYCVDGNTYDIIPPPDDGYTGYINYESWPTDFSASVPTAVADITNVDDLLIYYAVAELFRKLGQFDRSLHWEAVFERRYKRARVADVRRPVHMPTADGVISVRRRGPRSAYWNNPEVG